jgi:hypothetical protein
MDVPAGIANLRQWVLWRYVGDDRRKVPFQFNGQPAKSNDSTTWGPLPERTPEGYEGLGFVFADGGGIFGVDLDGCITPDGEIQPWATEILAQFPTYAEVSPSGLGIKIFGRGRIPGDTGRQVKLPERAVGDRTPAVEVYGRGRYFTVTGLRISEATDLADCQTALEALYARFWPPAAGNGKEYKPIASPASDVEQRPLAYLHKIPPAVSGQERGKHTFRVACVLVLGFGLSPDIALPLIREWNSGCTPNDWPQDKIDKELARTLANANKQSGPRGWLLDDRGYSGPDVDLRAMLASLADPSAEESPTREVMIEFPQVCLDGLPWLMRLAFDYVMETAIKPQSQLTLAALIAFFGAVFGRKVRDDYGTRTNVMTLGLAPSGAGKEHPRQVVKQLLDDCGLLLISGPERVGSHAGIVSSMAQHPVRLFQLDEIGRLLATMRDPRHAPHLYNVGTVLMQLYSSAGTTWTGDAYADLNKVKRINQPCVCVFGTAVPESFYSGLTPENLSDGLLGRLIVLESAGYGNRQRPEDKPPPAELLDGIKRWHIETAGGNLNAVNPTPLRVEKTSEAIRRHEQYCDEVHGKHRAEDDVRAAVWSRAPEKEAKLALIYACCDAMSMPPAITLEAVDWARSLVNYSTRLVLNSSANVVSRNRYEEEKKRVWRMIVDGMTLSELTRKTQWLRKRDRLEIVSDLTESGAIVMEETKTKTKPKMIIHKTRRSL